MHRAWFQQRVAAYGTDFCRHMVNDNDLAGAPASM